MSKFNDFEKKVIINSLKDLGVINICFESWSPNLSRYSIFFKHNGIISCVPLVFEQINNGIVINQCSDIDSFIKKANEVILEKIYHINVFLNTYKENTPAYNSENFLFNHITSILNLCDYHTFFNVTLYNRNSEPLSKRIEELLLDGKMPVEVFEQILKENNVDIEKLDKLISSIEDENDGEIVF